MSTTTFSSGDTLDISGTEPIPALRLLRVELRKMRDTRAGMWLLIAIGAVTVLFMTIFLLNADVHERTFHHMIATTAIPQGFLLPVLGILLLTQEWGQRTGMVTFTLEPHRGKVLWTKVAAAVLFALGALLIGLFFAAIGTLLFGGPDPWSDFSMAEFGKLALLQVSSVVGGLVFGLIFLNSAAAIVLSFVLPTAFSIMSTLWSAMRSAAPWVDLGTSNPVLYRPGSVSGEQWLHLLSGSMIWIIVPFAIGMWRVLRTEVK